MCKIVFNLEDLGLLGLIMYNLLSSSCVIYMYLNLSDKDQRNLNSKLTIDSPDNQHFFKAFIKSIINHPNTVVGGGGAMNLRYLFGLGVLPWARNKHH